MLLPGKILHSQTDGGREGRKEFLFFHSSLAERVALEQLSQFFGQAGGATYADKNREILTYLLHLDWDFKCGERRKGEGNIN